MTNFANLSNDDLRAEVAKLARLERQATAALIRCLMEVDARRLYLADGYSSLFAFCTQVLHLSEHAALGRIEVARAGRRLPALLAHLEEGFITVTNARLLAPHLTESNCEELLLAARHRSKREVEEMVAKLRPQPDVRSAVRKLPSPPARDQPPVSLPRAAVLEPPHVDTVAASPMRPVIAPLAPERYRIQFTASKELLDKLRYAQDLLRHVTPSGDVAVVFDRALNALIEQLEKQKCGLTPRPRKAVSCTPGSRHIPAAVRREVWRRDGGRCAFIGAHGRCNARAFLEFHHVVPFAIGGRSEASNIQLRCRAHNLYEADLFVGADVVREPTVRWGDSDATGLGRRVVSDASRPRYLSAPMSAPQLDRVVDPHVRESPSQPGRLGPRASPVDESQGASSLSRGGAWKDGTSRIRPPCGGGSSARHSTLSNFAPRTIAREQQNSFRTDQSTHGRNIRCAPLFR